MRILIAEDDQVLADGLLHSLRNAGYAVDQVSSSVEADSAPADHEFDLLILDPGLPRMLGREVLRKLRARGSAMPVLILTAADSVEQRPFDEFEAPEEVSPLVLAINDLLTRLDLSITTQKRFPSNAAHQLKTPLAGVHTQAELAQREIEEGQGDLTALKRSLQHIAHASYAPRTW